MAHQNNLLPLSSLQLTFTVAHSTQTVFSLESLAIKQLLLFLDMELCGMVEQGCRLVVMVELASWQVLSQLLASPDGWVQWGGQCIKCFFVKSGRQPLSSPWVSFPLWKNPVCCQSLVSIEVYVTRFKLCSSLNILKYIFKTS